MSLNRYLRIGIISTACWSSTALAIDASDNTFKKNANDHQSNSGIGISVGDINNNGIDEILVGTYRLDRANSGFSYRIGWDIDGEGAPKYWTEAKDISGTGWIAQDISVALYDRTIGDGATEVVFGMFDGNRHVDTNEFRYRYGTLDKHGNFTAVRNHRVKGFSKHSSMGVEIYDIDGNTIPEIILVQEQAYKIGWNIDNQGYTRDWTSHSLKYIGSKGEKRFIPGTAAAFTHLDRHSQPEFVIGHAEGKHFTYSIGYNIQTTGPNRGEVASWSPGVHVKDMSDWVEGYQMDMTVLNTALVKDEDLNRLADPRDTSRSQDLLEKTFLFGTLDYSSQIKKDIYMLAAAKPSNETNLVANPNLNKGLENWTYGPDASNGSHENGMICIGDAKPDSYWRSQARTLVSVERGKRYLVQFDAVADRDGRIAMNLQQLEAPYTLFNDDYDFRVKAGRHRYQIPFEVPDMELGNPLTKIVFITGRKQLPVDRFCLDNVRVTEMVDTSGDFENFGDSDAGNLIKNSNFEHGTLAGWHEKFGDGTAHFEVNYDPSARIENGAVCLTQRDITFYFQQALSQNNLVLEKGGRYRLSFDIASDTHGHVIKIGKDQFPWTAYFDKKFFNNSRLSRNIWEHISFEFVMKEETDHNAGLALFLSQNRSNLEADITCVDNFKLLKL